MQNGTKDLSISQYWTAISILLNNYHTINRKLCACVVSKVEGVKNGIEKLFHKQTHGTVVTTVDQCTLMRCIQNNCKNLPNDEFEGFVIHFNCLLKKGQDGFEAVGILDFLHNSFRLTFECDTIDDFVVKFHDNGLHINVLRPQADSEASVRWSEHVLKPKLLKWAQVVSSPEDLDTVFSGERGSLRLVDIERYNKLYNELKKKYSEKALKFWNDANESTDPLKFIYEDLAIAAYLITLWQSNAVNHSPQAFADLGCGNGLLVYILMEEGYTGYGYDVRCRKLWSYYPLKVGQNLFEQTVEPFKFKLPSNVDWLIGNHSDELSPWIPVLAATSHYQMSYFLLPCCAFEFSGSKFQRRNSSVSGYKDFCDYAASISSRCGFVTEKDRLKIPSTKRIAFIGRRRDYSSAAHLHKVDEIKEFVNSEKQCHSAPASHSDVKLRDKVEIVRNCTQIDKAIINKIVMKIFTLLLSENDTSDTSANVLLTTEWRTGRSLSMLEIAKGLEKQDLKAIKSECGGLKTLLRNKHEIFELYKPDFVKIRKPQLLQTNKLQTIKKRMCFFKEHHPQGCPLTAEECTFVH